MKASNENELNIIDMDSLDTNALPIIEDSDLTAATPTVGATPIYIQPAADEPYTAPAASDSTAPTYVEATPIYIQQAAETVAEPEYTGENAYTEQAYEESSYAEETAAEAEYAEPAYEEPAYTEESIAEPAYEETVEDTASDGEAFDRNGSNDNNNDPYTDDTADDTARPVWARRNGSAQILIYFALFFVSIC